MNLWSDLARRLRAWFRKEELDEELDEELRFHLEMQTRENVEAGMAPEEAHYAALRSFGRVDRVKETCRDQRGWVWLEHLAQDLRFGVRLLRRDLRFTALAVATLAMGLGVNLVLFALLDAELLRPRAVVRPEEIWEIYPSDKSGEPRFFNLSRPYYDAVRSYNRVFTHVVGIGNLFTRVRTRDGWEDVRGAVVSGDYFTFCGVQPFLGRGFLPEEDAEPGTHGVAVISYRFWQDHFQGDPRVLGKTLDLRGRGKGQRGFHPVTRMVEIVGVSPPGFAGMNTATPAFWVPASMETLFLPINYSLFARLNGRITPPVAAEALMPIVQEVTRTLHPGKDGAGETPSGAGNNAEFTRVALLRAGYGTMDREWLHLASARNAFLRSNSLAAMVTLLVLVLALSNLVNLLLARGLARRPELATRLALGATRWALLRQSLAEGLLLAGLGATVALLALNWFGRLLPSLLSSVAWGQPNPETFHIDLRVAAFAMLGALVVGAGLSLWPALKATRFELYPALKAAAGDATGQRSLRAMSRMLVVGQVAGSLVLLTAVCLCLRTIAQEMRTDLGFRPEPLLRVAVDLETVGYTTNTALAAVDDLTRHFRGLPGVEAVGIESAAGTLSSYDVPGHEGTNAVFGFFYVGAGCFGALGIPLAVGREIDARDLATRNRVAIVNESFARKYWPGQAALGKEVGGLYREHFVVIGVVQDARLRSPVEIPRPTVYYPLNPYVALQPTFILRSRVNPRSLVKPVGAILGQFHPRLSNSEVVPMSIALEHTLASERRIMDLLGELAVVALGLTTLGAYGLVSYLVTRRTREIGVRLALGARRTDVARLVLRFGLWLALTGIGVGLPAALGASLLFRHFIFGINPFDLPAFLMAGGAVLSAVLLAAWLPARRAMRIDPMTALRYE